MEHGKGKIKIVGGAVGGSTPLSQQPPTTGLSAQRMAFDRECDEVYRSLFDFRKVLATWFEGFNGLAGMDDIEWDDIEDQELDISVASCGLPLRLLQLVLTRAEDPVTEEQYRSECGPGGPYFGCRRGETDEDYLLKAYGPGGPGVMWDAEELFAESRWDAAFEQWKIEQAKDLDAHRNSLLEEFERWAAEAERSTDVVLRIPGSLARALVADPDRLCPDCLLIPPGGIELRHTPQTDGFEIRISCPSCSEGRPDHGYGNVFAPTLAFYWHPVSSWGSVKELLDQERIDSALADWSSDLLRRQ